MHKKILLFFIAFGCSQTSHALATNNADNAFNSSLEEELSWLQAEAIVFSASRQEQRVLDTPAAVFVINQEEIKRSGVTSVPEALRMVPGLQVAKINGSSWAITSRGFNRSASNKLLVMIDGRTIYHPVFSGTLWESKDVMLEDIERIEVIRGPGATMWGSNAVNGVISIMTKKASDTQGALITAGGGLEEQAFGSARYGGNLDENIDYRAYVKYGKRDRQKSVSGADGNDEWENLQGGFRLDANLTKKGSFTLQGDIYHGNGGSFQTIASPVPPTSIDANIGSNFSGGNLLAKWKHTLSSTAGYSLQFYFDLTEDKTTFSSSNDSTKATVKTYDADFQNHFQLQPWQNITWGLGIRHIKTDSENAVNFSFSPTKRDSTLYSVFIQDELTLLPDTLKLILGSKFEHNDFSGFEYQPSARLIFTPDTKQSLWASVSRAVRIPNRLDHDLQDLYLNQAAPNVFVSGQNNSDFDAERLIAYEVGYRIQPIDKLLFDLTTFYNDYDNLTTAEIGSTIAKTSPTPHFIIPVFPDNKGEGETYGIEIMAQWNVQDWWRLQGNYSYFKMKLNTVKNSTDAVLSEFEGDAPQHQYRIQSSVDLPNNISLDTTLRYVDELPNQNVSSYTEIDVRIAWKPLKNLELSLVGQNLLSSHHAEYNSTSFSAQTLPIEIQRSFYGKLSWNY